MDIYKSLSAIFSRENELCKALLSLLDQENQALKKRSFESLNQVTHFKQEKLLGLESLARQRQQLIQSFKPQGATDKQTLDFMIQRAPESIKSEFTQRWFALSESLQACKEKNEINGRLIYRSRRVVEQLIKGLQGNRESVSVYNKKGEAKANYSQSASVRA